MVVETQDGLNSTGNGFNFEKINENYSIQNFVTKKKNIYTKMYSIKYS